MVVVSSLPDSGRPSSTVPRVPLALAVDSPRSMPTDDVSTSFTGGTQKLGGRRGQRVAEKRAEKGDLDKEEGEKKEATSQKQVEPHPPLEALYPYIINDRTPQSKRSWDKKTLGRTSFDHD